MEEKKKLSLKKPEKNTEDLITKVTIKEFEKIIVAGLIDDMDPLEYARQAVTAAPSKRSRATEDSETQDTAKADQELRIKVSKTNMERIKVDAKKKGLTLGEYFRKSVVTAAWRHMLDNKVKAYECARTEVVDEIIPQMKDWYIRKDNKKTNTDC